MNERSTLALLVALSVAGQGLAQTPVTISTGPSNSTQTFYSLQNGEVDARPLDEWDIAFELTGITGSILVNTAKGVQLYKAPYAIAQWNALDTTGLAAGWAPQHNSTSDWSSGAFNQGLTQNPFDLGWGIYNMVTHTVTGDSLFVLRLANAQWKKIRIDGYSSTTNSFTFTWADLDGSNEISGTLNRSDFTSKNFGYVDLATNTVIDREPVTTDWDLLFTKYVAFVPVPVPSHYPVAGVLQNRGVEVQRVNGVTETFNDWAAGTFDAAIDGIGFDWKSFNQQTFQWEYATDRVHFAKDRDGNIWKLVFTAYGGSANGNMTFTQELVSATGSQEVAAAGILGLFPNPATNGVVRLVLDAPARAFEWSMIDASGRIARSGRFAASGGITEQVLDVHGLVPGLYTVQLMGEGLRTSSRLLVQ